MKPKYEEKAKLCVWIRTVSLSIFMKTLQKMLKKDLILQTITINCIPHYIKEKDKKVIGLLKDELSGEIMKELAGLRVKTYSYLIDYVSVDKKVKGAEKFTDYKNCLKATQLENEIDQLEKS